MCGGPEFWITLQVLQDLNLRLTVLETVALPTELKTYIIVPRVGLEPTLYGF